MTPTFLEELERMKAAATEGKDNNQSELTASELMDAWREEDKLADFLVNKADAIAELVRAAEKTVKDFRVPKGSVFYSKDLAALEKAVEKLNGGKSCSVE